MYCPYCGTQIPEDAAFCPKCGKTMKGRNASSIQKQKPIISNGKMTQTEFIRDYRKRWGFYPKCIGLGISIVGVIIMLILLLVELYRYNTDFSHQMELALEFEYGDGGAGYFLTIGIMALLFLLFLVISLVLQSKVRAVLRNEVDDWKRYAKSSYNDVTAQWKCPNCGKLNASYVGTCGCGTRRPN